MTGTILLIGGTGKTGLPLAHLLDKANYPFLVATREPAKVPAPFKSVSFDWLDASTFMNPFKVNPGIDRVYLISPAVHDVLPIVKPFVELAIQEGVKRFVLLSSTPTPKRGPYLGKIHEYLEGRDIDYAVLRPTWFIENFGPLFLRNILVDNAVFSTTKDGRDPFVSVDDIAKVAFKALTYEKSRNTEHTIVGPELYTYDEVFFSRRNITHKRLTQEDGKAFWLGFGLPEDYALAMIGMEDLIPVRDEEAHFHAKVKEVGNRRLKDLLQGQPRPVDSEVKCTLEMNNHPIDEEPSRHRKDHGKDTITPSARPETRPYIRFDAEGP
ncbi:Agroclavine dehydrogenase [Hypsizygus marmoreus]|uniref:Agroclavine dehydrogenase n=1 Tax=Hypsizygus marmoreus TaxID=39966 RepID=A0A369K6U4_HYPMA|nr:Agroclavine dehydrogenase [Hypsizygus marmoreus]